MEKTRILHVTGDDDFGANYFEDEYGIDLIKQDLIENPTKTSWEDPDGKWDAQLTVYDKIDPKFLTYVGEHLMDYDFSKHTNFYVID